MGRLEPKSEGRKINDRWKEKKNYEWPVNWVGRVGEKGRRKTEKGRGAAWMGPVLIPSNIPAGRQEEPYTCTIHHERTRN